MTTSNIIEKAKSVAATAWREISFVDLSKYKEDQKEETKVI